MRNISPEELAIIIKNHKRWLDKDGDGWETMQANLSYANLCRADLEGADLRNANLYHANLSNADLRGTDLRFTNLRFTNLEDADLSDADLTDAELRDANLSDANLFHADLNDADLRSANLYCADLSYADLGGANLYRAVLRDTNLRGTYLRYANLCYADLRGADLRFASLRFANLEDADLRDAKNAPYIPMICPEEGEFIGYKKASGKIIKLCIPEDAKRSSATTRKCRCDRATVLAIYELDGSISKVTEVASNRDCNFIYRINEEVVVDDFDEDRWNECSTGIHFFMQRHEAVKY